MLGLFNIRALNINIQQEAQSKVRMESWLRQAIDTLAVLKSAAVLIEPDSYLVDDAYIITFDAVREIDVDGQAYLVFDGPNIRRFFIVPNVTAKLEATSALLAGDSPIRNLDITLEGESTATAWVTHNLSGNGRGKSRLVYKGAPAIAYTTEGEASIEKIP